MFQTEKNKMRTPKHKKMMQKAKNSAAGKLRKKAMKNKAFKKTLLDVGGDDTREDIRDLMNESDMSFNGFVSILYFNAKLLMEYNSKQHKSPRLLVFHHQYFTLRTSNTKQLSQIYLRTRHTGHRKERKIIATFIAPKRANSPININDNHTIRFARISRRTARA